MADSYEKYFQEFLASASRHKFWDSQSGYLGCQQAARLRCRLDFVQSQLDECQTLDDGLKLERLHLSVSAQYMAWLRQLGLTTASAATSLKRVSAGALQTFDHEKQALAIDAEQAAIEKEIFGD